VASKYDAYWEGKKSELAFLIDAAATGRPAEIDVSDIIPLGQRDSWYGRTRVRSGKVDSADMAHATSLGRMVARLGLCARYPDKTFSFNITRDATLRVTVEGEAPRSAPLATGLPTATRPPKSVRVPTESAAITLDPSLACGQLHDLLMNLPAYASPAQVPFRNGLYFFYEAGEEADHATAGRIVRIGNHPRVNDRLIGRLRDHYATRPNAKNGSVFRRYLGGALLRRDDPSSSCLEPGPGLGHWERQHQPSCPHCVTYEQRVTDLLNSRFTFRCVRFDDRAERNRFEALLIATVAACDMCRPSARWLGHHAYSAVVQGSGLWNSNHVGGATLSEVDLGRFQQLVRASQGSGSGEDLSSTLLLIPCCGEKKGMPDPGLPSRSVTEYLGAEASTLLEDGRPEPVNNFETPSVWN